MNRNLRWHGDRGLDWRFRKIRKPQAKLKGRIAGAKGHGDPSSDREMPGAKPLPENPSREPVAKGAAAES